MERGKRGEERGGEERRERFCASVVLSSHLIQSQFERRRSWAHLLYYATAVGNESHAGLDSEQAVLCVACNEEVASLSAMW